jgi:hypothetical protein
MLASRPQLHAAWIASRNRRASLGPRAVGAIIAGATTAAALVVLLFRSWPTLIAALGSQLLLTGVPVAVSSSLWVQRARAAWTARYAGDWLSTLPVSRRRIGVAIAVRAFLAPLLLIGGVLLLAPLLAVAAPAARTATWQLVLGIVGAIAGGALLGWWLPRRLPQPAAAISTQLGLARPARVAALGGLTGWATIQARAWLPPRTIARLIVPVMLLLPMGTSGNLAVAIGASWTLALYLFVLLRATVLVAREAAAWLRPTPVSLRRFAWAVGWQPVLKQIEWSLVAAALLGALGISPALALRGAEIWLAVVGVTTSSALVGAWRGAGLGIGWLAMIVLLAALERLRAWLALPVAVLIAAAQFLRYTCTATGAARP